MPGAVRPEWTHAREHLRLLSGSWDQGFTFQILPDQESASVRPRVIHGKFSNVASMLLHANREGGGVFVTLNETDGLGRSSEHIVAIRALAIDCDRPHRRGFALQPSFSVETSPGRGHHYWCLSPGTPLALFKEAQRQLAAYYDSDPAVCDLGRVLRLAGFANRKRADVFITRLVEGSGATHSLDQVIAAHHFPPRRRRSRSGPYVPTGIPGDSGWFVARARAASIDPGQRNNTAFRIAAIGLRAGLPPEFVAAEVYGYCERAGILGEAKAVFTSARRIVRHVR